MYLSIILFTLFFFSLTGEAGQRTLTTTPEQDTHIQTLTQQTGLTEAEIFNRALTYGLPLVLPRLNDKELEEFQSLSPSDRKRALNEGKRKP